MESLTTVVLEAVKNSPSGIAALDLLRSLELCDQFTLKTTLSRLNKAGKIVRLKRGVYATNPIKNVFAAAQATFNGYLGFSSALYLHGLIAETPFSITVVTPNESALKVFGMYEFRAVALGNRAVGFENLENLVISTKAKTLFDCTYLERYSVEKEKLAEAYRAAPLSAKEWKEFDHYVKHFEQNRSSGRFEDIEKLIGRRNHGR